LTEKEVGQGIVSPQEISYRKHLPLLEDVRIGDGIFVMKPDEIVKLSLSDKEEKL